MPFPRENTFKNKPAIESIKRHHIYNTQLSHCFTIQKKKRQLQQIELSQVNDGNSELMQKKSKNQSDIVNTKFSLH